MIEPWAYGLDRESYGDALWRQPHQVVACRPFAGPHRAVTLDLFFGL